MKGARKRERLRLGSPTPAEEEARAVMAGIAETVGLERRRGSAFVLDDEQSPGRERPYRRQPGLDWLARKSRISEAQKAAGERYRDAYAIAQPTVSLASTLEVQPGMGSGGPPLKALLARAGMREAAEMKLALYRRQLAGHPAMIAACDLICGRELTPREAGGGDREGLKLEAVLLVALDLLASAAGSRA